MSIIIIVSGISIFSIRAAMDAFESRDNVQGLISSAIANAKALAAKEGKLAGIRFQKIYDPSGVENASQYMIFIVSDAESASNLTASRMFVAAKGKRAIKLPDSIGVMDLRLGFPQGSHDEYINTDNEIATTQYLSDTTTFSIIFNPTGKLISIPVNVRNRDGEASGNLDSLDELFNTFDKITQPDSGSVVNRSGIFLQDGNANGDDESQQGIKEELGRSSFIIYDREILNKTDENKRWSEYLNKLPVIYLNSYTSELVVDE